MYHGVNAATISKIAPTSTITAPSVRFLLLSAMPTLGKGNRLLRFRPSDSREKSALGSIPPYRLRMTTSKMDQDMSKAQPTTLYDASGIWANQLESPARHGLASPGPRSVPESRGQYPRVNVSVNSTTYAYEYVDMHVSRAMSGRIPQDRTECTPIPRGLPPGGGGGFAGQTTRTRLASQTGLNNPGPHTVSIGQSSIWHG